jgi:tRNA(adenine34) deaminase
MTPDDMLAAAIAVAEEGRRAGELPIGAVVVLGEEIVGRAYTQEKTRNRRLVHADLLAMTYADELLGLRPRPALLQLAVNLEPCLMCLGAAMSLGVADVFYGLESPADGAASVAANWKPGGDSAGMPSYASPAIVGGIRRSEVRDQFRRYGESAPDSGFRRWARKLANLPATPAREVRG